MAQGRRRDAHGACVEALQCDPECAEAYLILGELAQLEAALPQALDLFRRSRRHDPANPDAPIGEAEAAILLNRTQEAQAAADLALQLAPVAATRLNALGVVFSRLGEHDRSIDLFQRATTTAPRQPQYPFNLGCAQQFVGDFEGAARSFRRCIDIDPKFGAAYVPLIDLTPQTPEFNFIPRLKRLFTEAGNDPAGRLAIGHALARSYEDLGDYASALHWLDQAKSARRRARRHDSAGDEAMFATAAETLALKPPVGQVSHAERPIFVVGLPRSGTTLTDRILSCHPDVNSIGEAVTFPLLVKQMTGDASTKMMDATTFRRAQALDAARLGRRYLEASPAAVGASLRFVDKLPFNFLYMGLIHRALPNARIVCLRRDPMDVCLSNYRLLFGQDSPFHEYVYDLEDTARYCVLFDRLIATARTVLPADRFMELSYEALVADQEGQTRRLLSFCGLDWTPVCLDFHLNRTGVATASARQVRDPLFSTSIGRWRRYGEGLQPAIDILANAGLTAAGRD